MRQEWICQWDPLGAYPWLIGPGLKENSSGKQNKGIPGYDPVGHEGVIATKNVVYRFACHPEINWTLAPLFHFLQKCAGCASASDLSSVRPIVKIFEITKIP